MRALRGMAAIGIALLVACGLDVTGTSTALAPDAGPSPGRDASTGADAADVGDDAPNDDAGVGLDAGSCADAATARFTSTTGTLEIHPAPRAVTIDGELGEWACTKFFTFDRTSAAEVHGDAGIPNTYSFALAYDATKLYVAVRATDPQLLGDVTPDVFQNDAVELFLGGDAVFDGTYDAADHQYVVDWKNRSRVYQNNGGAPASGAFASAVRQTTTGYVVEASIGASEVGRAAYTSGASLGWGIAGDNSDGTMQTTWMNWWKPSAAACVGGCCSIWCNTLLYATLSLGP